MSIVTLFSILSFLNFSHSAFEIKVVINKKLNTSRNSNLKNEIILIKQTISTR